MIHHQKSASAQSHCRLKLLTQWSLLTQLTVNKQPIVSNQTCSSKQHAQLMSVDPIKEVYWPEKVVDVKRFQHRLTAKVRICLKLSKRRQRSWERKDPWISAHWLAVPECNQQDLVRVREQWQGQSKQNKTDGYKVSHLRAWKTAYRLWNRALSGTKIGT